MPSSSDREELLQELFEDGEAFFSGGRFNNIFDIVLTVITVVASLAATGLAASGQAPRWLLTTIAALPAAITGIQQAIDIRGRSNWYFLYAAKVRALEWKLKFADSPNIQEIAEERANLELVMEIEWPKVGHLLSASSVRKGGSRR